MEVKKKGGEKHHQDQLSSSSSDNDDQDDIETIQEEIEIDFDLFNPKESDFHCIKTFLRNYLEGSSFISTDLADKICEQGIKDFLGSIIKIQSEEITGTTIKDDEQSSEMKTESDEFFNEGFGFISVINLHKYQNKEYVVQIKKYILSKLNDPEKKRVDSEII